MYPERIPPARMNPMYRRIIFFFMNTAIPAMTHALVAGPVIRKAIIEPPLAPPSNSDLISGTADSPAT